MQAKLPPLDHMERRTLMADLTPDVMAIVEALDINVQVDTELVRLLWLAANDPDVLASIRHMDPEKAGAPKPDLTPGLVVAANMALNPKVSATAVAKELGIVPPRTLDRWRERYPAFAVDFALMSVNAKWAERFLSENGLPRLSD